MSGNSSSTSDTDKSYEPQSNLTDLALGGGQRSIGAVGMSTPLPYSPTEIGAVRVGHAHTANQGTSRAQHKSPSAKVIAMGQNRSSPLDTVRPLPCSTAEQSLGQGHYGAWLSTTVQNIDTSTSGIRGCCLVATLR